MCFMSDHRRRAVTVMVVASEASIVALGCWCGFDGVGCPNGSDMHMGFFEPCYFCN